VLMLFVRLPKSAEGRAPVAGKATAG
jgi:hypothetical protein